MHQAETALGGARHDFPTTLWSDILEAADPVAARRREAMESLLCAYWKPAYTYIRIACSKSIEDAKDLTQAFLTHVLESDFLTRVAPGRGTFRSYLKQALRNFVIDAERARAARRPGTPLLSLDLDEVACLEPHDPAPTPDEAFDRAWFKGIIEDALAALRAELEAGGKAVYYDVFESYCLQAAGSYGEIASRCGLKETDVTNYLRHCRQILGERIRARIRGTVGGDADVEREFAFACGL